MDCRFFACRWDLTWTIVIGSYAKSGSWCWLSVGAAYIARKEVGRPLWLREVDFCIVMSLHWRRVIIISIITTTTIIIVIIIIIIMIIICDDDHDDDHVDEHYYCCLFLLVAIHYMTSKCDISQLVLNQIQHEESKCVSCCCCCKVGQVAIMFVVCASAFEFAWAHGRLHTLAGHCSPISSSIGAGKNHCDPLVVVVVVGFLHSQSLDRLQDFICWGFAQKQQLELLWTICKDIKLYIFASRFSFDPLGGASWPRIA